MSRAVDLCLLAALALLASCAIGDAPPEPGQRRAKSSVAAICTAVPTTAGPTDGGPVADTQVADAPGPGSDAPGDGSGSDAPGPGSDAPGDGSGSDAPGPGSDAPGPGSDGGMDGGMDCKGLDIVEAMLPLVPMGSGTAEVRSVTGFTDQMISASISGDGFVFTTPGCGPQLCNFAATPKTLPFVLTIACNATDGMPHSGTLRANGAQGPSDFDIASLSCASSASTPLINVAPAAINAGDVPVGTPSNHAFTVTNNGTATLTFSIALPTGAPEWTAPGSPCLAPAQCTVPPGGGVANVGVRFLPTTHGASIATVSITSNAGSRSVDLAGNGVGSRIALPDPSDLDINFGTIPRNSTTTRQIEVTAIGNLPVSIAAGDPGAPFTVTPPQLALSPGVPQMFTVGCGAPSATGPITKTVPLTGIGAYALDASAITVRCEVANTQVSVAPNAFDFDEVRRGTAAPTLPFMISNPGPLPATITAVDLAGAPASLAMSVDGGGFPRTLAVGASFAGRLTLSTDEDTDLAGAAPKLRIAVDGEQLVYPVAGKVTTPAAYVTPEKLELGTACLGSGVNAMVAMVNSGTARLTMEPPEATGTLALELLSPPSYPATLLAGTMATLGVVPAMQAPGEVTGTLTWAVDAPRSPFEVPIRLAFIETGTAISPASLFFSTVKIKETSLRSSVTLQNCSADPVRVTVDGVTASRGGIAAWKVEPSQDARTLAPQDKLTISVMFAPLRHGRHVAQLRLGVDGENRIVTLEGDGLDADFERTSFYACGCAAPRAWSGGPIVLAIALVVLRRRRRRATLAPR